MPVCITGRHRSGTSLVARLLSLCGLYLGPDSELPPPGPANEEGYWENSLFARLNEEILARLDRAWDLPPPVSVEWELQRGMMPLRVKAAEFIQQFGAHEAWGWKDPRNSLTLPFWTSLIPNLQVVICLRNPLEVAQSLHWRGASSDLFGFKLWLDYNERLLAATRPEGRVITHYDAYFKDPGGELERVLGLLAIPASRQAVDRACATISSSFRHHHVTVTDPSQLALPADVLNCYQEMCAEAGPVYQRAIRRRPAPAREPPAPVTAPARGDSLGLRPSSLEARSRWLTAQLAEKERAVQAMSAQFANLQAELQTTRAIADVASREVDSVHNSKAWRAATVLWGLRDRARRALAHPNPAGRIEVQARRASEPAYGKACIIILSYNELERLRECVVSIQANTDYPDYHVVIVDNASEAPVRGYLHQVAESDPRIRVILNDANLGFAAANNIGLQHAADSDFIVLLNNDTVVPPGWLTALLRHAQRPEVGIVGPVTNWTGNEAKIDVAYSSLDDMPAFAGAYTRAHQGQVFAIKMLAMYCVAMRRSILDEIGLLDERFGQGMFEDVDFARRVRQAGYQVICAEDVFVHHYGRSSFAKLPPDDYEALFERNKRLYEEKWGEPWIPHQFRAKAGRRGKWLAGFGSKTFRSALRFYLANNLINRLPSFHMRHWYYRHLLGYRIGYDSSIHMGTFVTGDWISIGDHVTINRRCYLDGRIGIEIKNSVNISPEVFIVSMEHDPDSPTFATRGDKVIIEDRVWIGARAMIAPGVRLGEGAVVGAGAVVTKDVRPYRIAVGVPAHEIRDRNRDIQYSPGYFPWFDTDVQR